LLTLPLDGLAAAQKTLAVYAAAILHALARDEQAGRRPRRLTEDGLVTWERFRHLLGPTHLLQLLAEDAAVGHSVPFDAAAFLDGPGLERLDEDLVGKWLQALPDLDLDADSVAYVQAQARLLGVSERMARSDLHKVQAHHKILELPGSGGQLSHFLAHRDGIYLQDAVTIACKDKSELILAGLIAVELGAPDARAFASIDPELNEARQDTRRTSFHYVLGRAPDKGGLYKKERLLEIFPSATVLLV
jgi:hypothetical protein